MAASPIDVSMASPLNEAEETMKPAASSSKPGLGLGRQEPIFVEDKCRYEKEHFVVPCHYKESLDYIMLSRGMINDRTEKLAMQIRQQYGDEELHVLCVLKGSRGFFSELLLVLDRIHRYSDKTYNHAPYLEHYIRLKRYSAVF